MNTFRSLVLVTLLAAAGCQKVNDVPRLQDAAQVTAKQYQERFDELTRRAQAIVRRGSALRADAPSSADAQRTFRQAAATIDEGRRLAQELPRKVDDAAKAGRADALHTLLDATRKQLDADVTEATTDLAAVESWMTIAEQRAGSAAAPATPPADAAGSAAPVQ